MSPTQPSQSLLLLLQQRLEAARAQDTAVREQNASGNIIKVPGVGKRISTAYEQLRNAAEYTEEHLLLQRAIRRFYKRNLSFFTKRSTPNIGEELIVELTQAGYLRNGDFSAETVLKINSFTQEHIELHSQLRQAHVPRDEANDWVLSILSVETEELLNPHSHLTALAYVVTQHYLELFPRESLLARPEEAAAYDISMYIAVHQALLKSDISIVRHDLMNMYRHTLTDIHQFIEFNRNATALYTSPLTIRLKRAVSKHCAPFRILKSMVEEHTNITELLADQSVFSNAYGTQTNHEYKRVRSRLNKGIIKSIVFILITKMVIGIGIEVPYDLIVVGSIAFLPLGINLLVPPLYMASLKLGLKVPSSANAHALRVYIEKALYSDEAPMPPMLSNIMKTASTFSKLLYGVLFFIPFAILVYGLILLHFNVVQTIIFFVFLSTASYLGFRLSSMIRELELVSHEVNFLTTVRDFFYLPFILVGQWLSSKYARINAVAHVLDILIELPLKTALRLLRQGMRFLNEKHEELY